jgi:chemotaxis regulatin CheY-phosphate phosphatase CheZ
MGCLFSVDETRREEQMLQHDMTRIHQYLMGRASIDDLWLQFDTNFDSKVDMDEFRDLLYHSEIYFVRMLNPMAKETPSRESLEAKIQRLAARFNENNDTRICKDEFKKYGKYLMEQKERIEKDTRVALKV